MGAPGVDIIIALFPPFDHLGDEFGRLLAIGVHNHHGITTGVIESGSHRNFLAKVSRKIQIGYLRVGGGLVL